MIVQNNSTPWIVLALVVMAGCALTGLLLGGGGPLSKDIAEGRLEITQTYAAIDARAKQSGLDAQLTQQASAARKTALVEELTAMPNQEVALYNAQMITAQSVQAAATGTALANAAYNDGLMAQATETTLANQMDAQRLAFQATATAIGQRQVEERALTILSVGLIGVGTIALVGWIIARAFTRAAIARAQMLSSQAQFLAEQRRLAAMKATIKEKEAAQGSRYPLPKSLLAKKTGDSYDLPKAE